MFIHYNLPQSNVKEVLQKRLGIEINVEEMKIPIMMKACKNHPCPYKIYTVKLSKQKKKGTKFILQLT